MDYETKIFQGLAKCLPRVTGSGFLAEQLRKFYCRKPRPLTSSTFEKITFELDPSQCVDSSILISPHLYEWRELQFLKNHLRVGGTFVDVGANIGFYSLVLSQVVGPGGLVIAFEADPISHAKFAKSITMSNCRCIQAFQKGISDDFQQLKLGIDTSGNRGGSSFLKDSNDSVMVECIPLYSALSNSKVTSIDAMKIDIEGFEFRVLKRFFSEAPISMWPRALMLENNKNGLGNAEGDVLGLLSKLGYNIGRRHGIDVMATLHSPQLIQN